MISIQLNILLSNQVGPVVVIQEVTPKELLEQQITELSKEHVATILTIQPFGRIVKEYGNSYNPS